MKRIVCLFLLTALILAASSAASEVTPTYHIAEKGVEIDVPIEIMCVSRTADETATYFRTGIYDYASVSRYMEENDLYLYGKTNDLSGEFSLGITDYGYEDLQSMSEASLSVLKQQFQAYYSSRGAKDIVCEIAEVILDKAVCVHCTYQEEQSDQYEIAYYTTHGSDLVSVRFLSAAGITEERERMIRDIFASIRWGVREEGKEDGGAEEAVSPGQIYIDAETGLMFPVPEGWQPSQNVTDDPTTKVKYRIGDENVWMIYGSADLWDQLSSWNDMTGISRADIDNSVLSAESFAQQFECAEDRITIKTIGGQPFYYIKTTYSVQAGALTVDTDFMIYVCVKNAYYYKFGLSGYGAAKYEDMFSRFMETVIMPR